LADDTGHLQCPFCNSYDVARMYLASLHLDSCECRGCGARWDEEAESGVYRGLASRTSAVTPRDR
jgi:transcription elongation factor Elf1